MPLSDAHIAQEIAFTAWQIQSTIAACVKDPEALDGAAWETTRVPGTVAQHLFAQKKEIGDFERLDWWYSTEFQVGATSSLARLQILLEGLATLTEVWLNGALVASSASMFLPVCVDHGFCHGHNTLHICFRSLTQALTAKRPRPAWKTPLVEQQQLRWFRTSLLGRMYGWTQPWPVLGPWRAVRCIEKANIYLNESHLVSELRGDQGHLNAQFKLTANVAFEAWLQIDQVKLPLTFQRDANQLWYASAQHTLDSVPVWWPHTHGASPLLSCELVVNVGGKESRFPLGRLGFRTINLDRSNGRLAFVVNGVEVFARGATWTTDDVVSLHTSKENLRTHLLQAREAGLNMLRLNGTMVYETDDFFDLCDELGILVWQDFMFACMDYPTQDADFGALVDAEAIHHIKRLASHPCMAAYCGSNEIQMQAMMVGLPSTGYANDFFDRRLPGFCQTYHPGIPYFASSPCEGDLPFQPQTGTSHYYGVGAFRQPLADAELAQVKFATECLAFSNVPEAGNIDLLLHGRQPYTHSPQWKTGVPRMASTGYDFEDVRDFYIKDLYGIDAMTLRAHDTPAYLNISRAVMAEVTEKTLALWRSHFTPCMGALLFFWRDLYPGAGWGAVDSTGQPKSVYYAWKRACQPRAIFLIPRGMNGLMIEVINETAQTQHWRIELKGFNHHDATTINVSRTITLAARSQDCLTADGMIGHFTDLPHVFRFGAVQHRVIHARLFDEASNELIAEDFFFPKREFCTPQRQQGLQTTVTSLAEGAYNIQLQSAALLHWVKLDIPNYTLSNNYFHLTPNATTHVIARPMNAAPATPLKGYLEALNLAEAVRIRA